MIPSLAVKIQVKYQVLLIVQQTMQRVRELYMLKKDKGGSGGGSEQREENLSMHAYSIRDRI